MTMDTSDRDNRVLFITGASRGIGRAIALAAAQRGMRIVIAAKSVDPHPKLPGTIFSVAREIEAMGGEALALQLDVRDEVMVSEVMQQAAEHFGGIDILINNAGAIKLQGVEKLPVKRYDLMQSVNARAVFVCAQAALPWLKQSANAQILSLAPPINLNPKWLGPYAPYTLSKYGMSLLSLGMAEEFRRYGVAVNTLWPQTLIATAAVEFEAGGPNLLPRSRKPEIMADAAVALISRPQMQTTGQCLIDEQVLREEGLQDLSHYRYEPGDTPLMNDLFLDE